MTHGKDSDEVIDNAHVDVVTDAYTLHVKGTNDEGDFVTAFIPGASPHASPVYTTEQLRTLDRTADNFCSICSPEWVSGTPHRPDDPLLFTHAPDCVAHLLCKDCIEVISKVNSPTETVIVDLGDSPVDSDFDPNVYREYLEGMGFLDFARAIRTTWSESVDVTGYGADDDDTDPQPVHPPVHPFIRHTYRLPTTPPVAPIDEPQTPILPIQWECRFCGEVQHTESQHILPLECDNGECGSGSYSMVDTSVDLYGEAMDYIDKYKDWDPAFTPASILHSPVFAPVVPFFVYEHPDYSAETRKIARAKKFADSTHN